MTRLDATIVESILFTSLSLIEPEKKVTFSCIAQLLWTLVDCGKLAKDWRSSGGWDILTPSSFVCGVLLGLELLRW